jgi:hypothetical protein
VIASNFLEKLQELREWETKAKTELGKFRRHSHPRKNIHGIPWSFNRLDVNYLSTCHDEIRWLCDAAKGVAAIVKVSQGKQPFCCLRF